MISRRQHQVMEFVRGFRAEHGYGPTIGEIRLAIGVNTKTQVNTIIQVLEAKKLVRRKKFYTRSIELVTTPEVDLRTATMKLAREQGPGIAISFLRTLIDEIAADRSAMK